MAYSFCITPPGPSGQLTYTDGLRRLEIGLDLSGDPEFDLVGCDTQLESWTEPDLRMTAQEREQFLTRLAEWSQKEGVRINFGPGVDHHQMDARLLGKGYTAYPQANGSILYKKP